MTYANFTGVTPPTIYRLTLLARMRNEFMGLHLTSITISLNFVSRYETQSRA
jgi:hypothetical protein